jgi:predicted O-methyltransferase YrrM
MDQLNAEIKKAQSQHSVERASTLVQAEPIERGNPDEGSVGSTVEPVNAVRPLFRDEAEIFGHRHVSVKPELRIHRWTGTLDASLCLVPHIDCKRGRLFVIMVRVAEVCPWPLEGSGKPWSDYAHAHGTAGDATVPFPNDIRVRKPRCLESSAGRVAGGVGQDCRIEYSDSERIADGVSFWPAMPSVYFSVADPLKTPRGRGLQSPSSVTPETAAVLYDFVRLMKPGRTLETGMAHGKSTLSICQAHRANGAGCHIAIDPWQETKFNSRGLANIERANLKDLLRFYQAPSDEVLPQLHKQGERIDFAFIDGNHRFQYTLLDFFYIDKMLKPGGHIAFDDLWLPAVRKVVSFVLKNTPYKLVRPVSDPNTPVVKRVLRLGRRIIQNPLGRDWALKLVPQNIVILQKMDEDSAGSLHHRAF